MNKVILIGRLAADPDKKTLQSGATVCNFSIAVDRRYKKDGQPTVDFFNCIAFNKTGDFVDKWFIKGKMIALEGMLQNRTWEDNDNKKHYATEVLVASVEFCGDKTPDSSLSSSTVENQSNTYDSSDNESESEEELPF